MPPAPFPASFPCRSACASALVALLAACATPYSEAPLATNFASSQQSKLQAAAHWQWIAADTATTLMRNLGTGKGCLAAVPDCGPIYVRESAEPTPFARAFRTAFITTLVNRGVVVVTRPAGARQVEINVQALRFSANRPKGVFESATAVYAGGWALYGLWQGVSPGASGALAAISDDAYRWLNSEFARGPTPQSEIIVTVSLSDSAQYLGRVTNVYYVADTDESLYAQAPAPVVYPIPVRGGE